MRKKKKEQEELLWLEDHSLGVEAMLGFIFGRLDHYFSPDSPSPTRLAGVLIAAGAAVALALVELPASAPELVTAAALSSSSRLMAALTPD